MQKKDEQPISLTMLAPGTLVQVTESRALRSRADDTNLAANGHLWIVERMTEAYGSTTDPLIRCRSVATGDWYLWFRSELVSHEEQAHEQ